MAEFRTHTNDIAKPIIAKPKTPGVVPPGKIGIYDHFGQRRGHVGPGASAATVRRFGVANAKLGTRDGRTAWLGSTKQTTGKRDGKHDAQLKSAKGQRIARSIAAQNHSATA